MRRDDDGLLRALGDANPVPSECLADWEKSEESQRVLARIMTARSRGSSASRVVLSTYRVAWLGGLSAAAIAVVLVWVLPTMLGPLGSDPVSMNRATQSQQQRSQPSTAPTVSRQFAIVSSSVSKFDALAGIVRMANDLHLGDFSSVTEVGSSGRLEEGLRRDARTLGILLPVGPPEDSLQAATTRGEYLVWLWGAFGKQLKPESQSTYGNLEELSPDQLRAVKGLLAAGILQPGASATLS